MRNPECKNYDECLTAAAKGRKGMECRGCERFESGSGEEEFRRAPRADRAPAVEEEEMAEDNVKNRLSDLNDHLFEQMERLNDDELEGDDLAREITRAKAMTNIAAQIIGNSRVVLDAAIAVGSGKIRRAPALLGVKGEGKD